jgi:hypothetical protein
MALTLMATSSSSASNAARHKDGHMAATEFRRSLKRCWFGLFQGRDTASLVSWA